MGCRPYIGLDACHLKGKWKCCLAAATAVDGNNWMFPVALAVMENENEESWDWFLRELHQAIGMPEGLVISSDIQKGLIKAVSQVYPLTEHRECMRHLYSNFKKHFSGDLFN
jgi:transposase-like protein